jgi:hypothetical protein
VVLSAGERKRVEGHNTRHRRKQNKPGRARIGRNTPCETSLLSSLTRETLEKWATQDKGPSLGRKIPGWVRAVLHVRSGRSRVQSSAKTSEDVSELGLPSSFSASLRKAPHWRVPDRALPIEESSLSIERCRVHTHVTQPVPNAQFAPSVNRAKQPSTRLEI